MGKLVSEPRGYRVKPVKKGPYPFVVYRIVGGEKRDRKYCDTETEANEHARAQNIRLRNEGMEAQILDPEVRAMALEGQRILKPYDKTIRDAVSYYAAELAKLQGLREVKLKELITQFLEAKRTDLRRPAKPRYLQTLKYRLGIMADVLGDTEVAEIKQEDVVRVINSRVGNSNNTFNAYLRDFGVFFAYALKEKYTTIDPTDGLKEMPKDKLKIRVLPPLQMRELLKAASPRLRILLALQGFAGIRRDEVQLLPWEAVNFKTGYVVVPEEIAKSGKWRPIILRPNLRAWLETVPAAERKGVMCDFRYHSELLAARKKAEIQEWPHNCLRHGFASYCLMAEGDKFPGRLQIELGHSTPEIVIRHYRTLVSRAEAKAWWKIFPS